MKIAIDHIAKIEGHAGFIGKIINGEISEAKIDVQEGRPPFRILAYRPKIRRSTDHNIAHLRRLPGSA